MAVEKLADCAEDQTALSCKYQASIQDILENKKRLTEGLVLEKSK